jgi:hypothetical protein
MFVIACRNARDPISMFISSGQEKSFMAKEPMKACQSVRQNRRV